MDDVLRTMEVVEKRNRNMMLVSETNSENMGDYTVEDNRILTDTKKLTAAVQNMSYGWLPCIAMIVILCSSYALEYENNINAVLEITRKGRWSIVTAKIVTAVVTAIILNVLFWGGYILIQWFLLGMTAKDWSQPLFLAEGYSMCASGMTFQQVLLKQILVSVLLSILTALFTIALSRKIKKGSYTLFLSAGIFVLMAMPDLLNTAIYNNTYIVDTNTWYLLSAPDFYKLLDIEKRINPVSMLDFTYFFKEPGYVTFAGASYKEEVFPVLIAIGIIALLVIVLFYEKRRQAR